MTALVLQSEIVELLRALAVALSRHAELESLPHDTGAASNATADTSGEPEAAAYSHLKPLAERVALVRFLVPVCHPRTM